MAMEWIKDLFGVEKPIIAMCHLKALPGDPGYDAEKGIDYIIESARTDLHALQEGGIDAVMFSNEASLPYLTDTEAITSMCMARIIAELKPDLKVPFGVNVLWDAMASIELAVATGALFVREIFTGVYASDYGTWDTNVGKVIRRQYAIHGGHVKLFYNIVPESAVYMAERDPASIAKSTVFVGQPDALCVSGLTAGTETDASVLKAVKETVPDVPVFANTGVNVNNVADQLQYADGTITATHFKRDGYIWNEVDVNRVKAFMDQVKAVRG